MIFAEPFGVIQSFGIVVALSSSIFAWRLYAARKALMQSLMTIPSIAVIGHKSAAKSHFIKSLGFLQSKIFRNVYVSADKKIQALEIDLDEREINICEKFNIKKVLFVFDVSKTAVQVETQLQEFERIKSNFKNLELTPIAIGSDDTEKEKVGKIEEKLGNVLNNYSTDLRKELEDIKLLQESLKESVFKTAA